MPILSNIGVDLCDCKQICLASVNTADPVQVVLSTVKIKIRQFLLCTVKPVLNGHSKRTQKLVFNTYHCLMQVKSIAECSRGEFCNTFDLH